MSDQLKSLITVSKVPQSTEAFLETDEFMSLISSSLDDLPEKESSISIIFRIFSGEYISNEDFLQIEKIIKSDLFRKKIKEKINEIEFSGLHLDEIEFLRDLLNHFSICVALISKTIQGRVDSILHRNKEDLENGSLKDFGSTIQEVTVGSRKRIRYTFDGKIYESDNFEKEINNGNNFFISKNLRNIDGSQSIKNALISDIDDIGLIDLKDYQPYSFQKVGATYIAMVTKTGTNGPIYNILNLETNKLIDESWKTNRSDFEIQGNTIKFKKEGFSGLIGGKQSITL